jgi:hypothetical protein
MTANRTLMSSMAARRYKSADVANPRGGYREPCIVTTPILDHRNYHYVKPNIFDIGKQMLETSYTLNLG